MAEFQLLDRWLLATACRRRWNRRRKTPPDTGEIMADVTSIDLISARLAQRMVVQTRPEQHRTDLAAYGYVPEPAELALIKAALGLAAAEPAGAGTGRAGGRTAVPTGASSASCRCFAAAPSCLPALREKVEQRYRAEPRPFREAGGAAPAGHADPAAARDHTTSAQGLPACPLRRCQPGIPADQRPGRGGAPGALLRSGAGAPGSAAMRLAKGARSPSGPGTHGAHLRHAQLGLEVDLAPPCPGQLPPGRRR